MSEKRTCPACGSHGSDVLRAFAAGERCPQCGLSAAAAVEVDGIRAARADEQLKQRLATLTVKADRLERELEQARDALDAIRDVVKEHHPRAGQPDAPRDRELDWGRVSAAEWAEERNVGRLRAAAEERKL
jgi:hypothetical protein